MGTEWAPPLSPITAPPSTRERIGQVWLLLPVLASIGAVITSLFALEWFTAQLPNGQVSGFGGVNELSIDLRSVSTCAHAPGQYCQTPLEYMAQYSGFHPYTTLSTVTFWASLAFAAFVSLQAASRFLIDRANKNLNIVGYVVGTVTMSCACATAYIFGPEFGSFDIRPTIAPVVLMLGCVLGTVTLYYVSKPPKDYAANSPEQRTGEGTVPRARALHSRAKS